MASALKTVVPVAIRRMVTKPGVQLTLTEHEAKVLFAIFMRVGGDIRNSNRKHVLSMVEALEAVGINSEKDYSAVAGRMGLIQNTPSLWFAEGSGMEKEAEEGAA